MKISHTELNDLLQKIFEGLGFSRGDYEDLARSICWLEFRNWPILKKVLDVAQKSQVKQPKISFEDSHSATIAVEKSIAFMAGALPHNLAYVKSRALEGTAVEVSLLNPILPLLLIPNLILIASRGYQGRIIWHEGVTQIFHISISARAIYPDVTIYYGEDLPRNLAAFVEVGTAVSSYSPPLGILEVEKISARTLRKRFTDNIANGLEIEDSLWQTMIELSKKVLVEATEESRNKGAGENA